MHVYEIRPRADRRGFELISDALPFGSLWNAEPNAASNTINYAKFYSRSHDAGVPQARAHGAAVGALQVGHELILDDVARVGPNPRFVHVGCRVDGACLNAAHRDGDGENDQKERSHAT